MFLILEQAGRGGSCVRPIASESDDVLPRPNRMVCPEFAESCPQIALRLTHCHEICLFLATSARVADEPTRLSNRAARNALLPVRLDIRNKSKLICIYYNLRLHLHF
jgi:hypothetical protein